MSSNPKCEDCGEVYEHEDGDDLAEPSTLDYCSFECWVKHHGIEAKGANAHAR